MKTIIMLVACGLIAAACGSGTEADVGDVTTVTATTAASTTTAATVSAGVYEVTLAVEFHEYTRIPGNGGIPTDYRLTYTVGTELTSTGDGTTSIEVVPADAEVVWTRNCFTTATGPDAELLSTHEGTNGLVIPVDVDDVPFDFGIEFAEADWLAGPAVSLYPVSAAIAVLHRVPSTLDLGSEIDCDSLGPSIVIPNAGAAWMTADMVSFSGESMSRADLLNLEAGSGDPVYIIGNGPDSGWIIGLISPGQLAAGSVPLNFSRQEADELGGWELTIEGEIRFIDAE